MEGNGRKWKQIQANPSKSKQIQLLNKQMRCLQHETREPIICTHNAQLSLLNTLQNQMSSKA
jgi:hypothetical protein